MSNFNITHTHTDVPLRWVRRTSGIPGYFRPKDSLNDGARVAAAIKRLSRDRWLSGPEVSHFAHKFARCSNSRQPYRTAEHCLPQMAFFLGLIRGEIVPAYRDEAGYGVLLRKLEKIAQKPQRGIQAEMAILKYQLTRK